MKKKAKALLAGASALMTQAMMTITSFANDHFDTGWITQVDEDPFKDITEKSKGYFSSMYSLISVISVGIVIFCLILIGLKFTRGGRKAEEAKDDLLHLLIGCALIFGAVAIVTTLVSVFS